MYIKNKMGLSLLQVQAITELADLLYGFLPGKAHPFASSDISFEGIANDTGLSHFWPGGSKKPAITQLLKNTLQQQSGSFCPLIVEIVIRGMGYRQSKNIPITFEEIAKLNVVVSKIGFKIPELNDKQFLNSLPKETQKNEETETKKGIPESERIKLTELLKGLLNMAPQKRGFEFEKFLKRLFEVSDLEPRSSFRVVGEQIDGSFQFQGETYLLEATWTKEPVGEEKLSSFSTKVRGKAEWTRGLLISYSGFTSEGLEAFSRGKQT